MIKNLMMIIGIIIIILIIIAYVIPFAYTKDPALKTIITSPVTNVIGSSNIYGDFTLSKGFWVVSIYSQMFCSSPSSVPAGGTVSITNLQIGLIFKDDPTNFVNGTGDYVTNNPNNWWSQWNGVGNWVQCPANNGGTPIVIFSAGNGSSCAGDQYSFPVNTLYLNVISETSYSIQIFLNLPLSFTLPSTSPYPFSCAATATAVRLGNYNSSIPHSAAPAASGSVNTSG